VPKGINREPKVKNFKVGAIATYFTYKKSLKLKLSGHIKSSKIF
jgi:hypothetical protein